MIKPKTLFLLAAAGAVAAVSYAVQSAPRLYSPLRSIADQGIALSNWGSGSISETDEISYEGTASLRVTSRNFFQGGVLNFNAPTDLSSTFADPANLLTLVVRTGEVTIVSGSTGGPGGAGPGAQGGSGENEGRGGGGLTAQGGPGGGAATTTTMVSEVKTIRLILTTTDGKKSEIYVPVATSTADAKGWRTMGIPLQAIRGMKDTNKQLKSISLSTDTVASIYLGEIRVANDPTPIYGEPNFRETNVGSGSTVTFSASGAGGSSVLRYSWDFDAKNGVAVDAEGQAVERRFRQPGTYTVTLTISDYYGLKKPYVTTLKVEVN